MGSYSGNSSLAKAFTSFLGNISTSLLSGIRISRRYGSHSHSTRVAASGIPEETEHPAPRKKASRLSICSLAAFNRRTHSPAAILRRRFIALNLSPVPGCGSKLKAAQFHGPENTSTLAGSRHQVSVARDPAPSKPYEQASLTRADASAGCLVRSSAITRGVPWRGSGDGELIPAGTEQEEA